VIDEFCAHRGVSLWFGRNEENGLRCPYHGWKYDVTGQCMEVPSEPVESGFCQKIKLDSYRCVELGDVIWIYMGPPELEAAAAGIRMGEGAAFASLRLQAHAGVQLPAGDGGRHRFRACLVPASP
jgi:phenylpropionate dioxygenase-like ring-hydroxylating dioxygenase large terminal subunit